MQRPQYAILRFAKYKGPEIGRAIKAGLRKGFQDGSSKMAHRKCYGYEVGPDGELTVNPDEAKVVCWIFEQYLSGNSLGKIAAGLEQQGILSLF